MEKSVPFDLPPDQSDFPYKRKTPFVSVAERLYKKKVFQPKNNTNDIGKDKEKDFSSSHGI